MGFLYRAKFQSNLDDSIDKIKSLLQKLTRNTILDEDLLYDIRLILSELVINGCEHGNCFDLDKHVFLKLDIMGSEVRIEIRDEGSGIDYSLADFDPGSMKTSGRGLKIVRELSDVMEISDNTIRVMINR